MKYTILDLDNCISHDEHRIPLINWRASNPTDKWNDYHAQCQNDEFVNRRLVPTEGKLIILTARPLKFRDITQQWLRKNEIATYVLLMRGENDNRSSASLKDHQLAVLYSIYGIRPKDICAAFDDKQEVVEMYKKKGIVAYQRRAHNTQYTPPPIVTDLLLSAAKTFSERNKLYGDSYKVFGKAAMHMFPDGLQTNTEAEWNRLGVFSMCLSKMTRYAAAMHSGGHEDSAHDLCVYAAMLEELTELKGEH